MSHQYVRDLMTKRLITATLNDSVAHVFKLMKSSKTHSILLSPARGGKSWWIFTETDLLLALESGEDPNNIPVGTYASPVRFKAKPDWDYQRALEEMINTGVKHLPVIDEDGNFIGIISSTDLINNY